MAQMNKEANQTLPKWLLPHALGVDVAFAAFVWGGACAAFHYTNVLGAGAMLLLAVAAWGCVMLARIVRAVGDGGSRYASFYRNHLAWLLLLLFCAAMAALWMLFFYVGRGLLEYALYVSVLLFWGVIFRGGLLGNLCRALSFSVACFAPAFFYDSQALPLALFFTLKVWGVACLFFLFFMHRATLSTKLNKLVSLISFVLFIWLVISIYNATPNERGFCCFMVLGLACVHLISRHVRKLGQDVSDALDWPLMGVAAVLGCMFFAPDVF